MNYIKHVGVILRELFEGISIEILMSFYFNETNSETIVGGAPEKVPGEYLEELLRFITKVQSQWFNFPNIGVGKKTPEIVLAEYLKDFYWNFFGKKSSISF